MYHHDRFAINSNFFKKTLEIVLKMVYDRKCGKNMTIFLGGLVND